MGWFKTSNVKFGYNLFGEDGAQSEPPLWISYDLEADERFSTGGTAIQTPDGSLADLPGTLTVVHGHPTCEWLKNRAYIRDKETKAEFLKWAAGGLWSETDHRSDYAIGVGKYYGPDDGEPGFSLPSAAAYYLTIACAETQIHRLIDAAKSDRFPLLDVSVDLAGPTFGSEIGPQKWDYNRNPLLLIFGLRFVFKTAERKSELEKAESEARGQTELPTPISRRPT